MSIRVFFVEDEYMVRENVKQNPLWQQGEFALVGEAANGEDALARMQEVEVDILLTDIRMPFMDGLALAAEVRERWPYIRIIILSGYDDFNYAKQAMKIGVTEYLVKPLQARDLLAALQETAAALLREREQRRRIETLYSFVASSREARLHKFFNEIATGLLTREAIRQGAQALDLRMEAPCYIGGIAALGIRKAPKDPENALQALQVLEVLSRLLAGHRDVYSFSRSGADVYFFLGAENAPAARRRAAQVGEQIWKTALGTNEVRHCFVTVGKPVLSLEDLSDSFADAQFSQNMRPLFGEKQVVFADELDMAVSAETLSVHAEKALIANLLRFGKQQDIPLVCSKLRQRLRAVNMSTVLFVYTSLGFVELIQAFCADIQIGIHEIEFDRPLNRLAQYVAANEIDLFVEAVGDMLSNILDYRDNRRERKHADLILASQQYIREHYASPALSLAGVAGHIGISSAYFSSLFRQETGTTFVEFVTSVRMEAAKELLAIPEKRTTEIAFDVGYSDPNYFSKLFKKLEGRSPREYRASRGIA